MKHSSPSAGAATKPTPKRKRLLTTLSLATIAAGLLPLSAEHSWLLELTSHFRVQYLITAAGLLLLAIAFRRRWIALMLLTTSAVNAWPLIPYLPRAPTAAGEALVVLNVNVRASNHDHARIIETIRANAPDVVTIIELTPALDRALHSLAPEYPYRFTIATDDNFGLGILSRHALIEPTLVDLEARPAIDTEVAWPGGRFHLLAVHAVPPVSAELAATRNAQLDTLAAHTRRIEGPVLICGDFNISSYSPYFARLQAASATTDTRRGLGPGMSWPSFLPLAGIPIDHCLTRAPLTSESVERLDDLGSDHYPMRVTLRWQAGP